MNAKQKEIESILIASAEPLSVTQIVERTGFERRRVYTLLYTLQDEGKIYREQRGVYTAGILEFEMEEVLCLLPKVWRKLRNAELMLRLNKVTSEWWGNEELGYSYVATVELRIGEQCKFVRLDWYDRSEPADMNDEVLFGPFRLEFAAYLKSSVRVQVFHHHI